MIGVLIGGGVGAGTGKGDMTGTTGGGRRMQTPGRENIEIGTETEKEVVEVEAGKANRLNCSRCQVTCHM